LKIPKGGISSAEKKVKKEKKKGTRREHLFAGIREEVHADRPKSRDFRVEPEGRKKGSRLQGGREERQKHKFRSVLEANRCDGQKEKSTPARTIGRHPRNERGNIRLLVKEANLSPGESPIDGE